MRGFVLSFMRSSSLYKEVTSYALSSLRKFESAEASVNKWEESHGTDWEQIVNIVQEGICKINTDTENRQTLLG